MKVPKPPSPSSLVGRALCELLGKRGVHEGQLSLLSVTPSLHQSKLGLLQLLWWAGVHSRTRDQGMALMLLRGFNLPRYIFVSERHAGRQAGKLTDRLTD